MIERVGDLITGKQAVLFDFDGPICRLFYGHPARDIAARLIERIESGEGPAPSRHGWDAADPHSILRAVHDEQPGGDLIAMLEAQVTEEELKATESAYPTPYADRLIQTWNATGVRLAVTTNNSPQAVEKYLAHRRLTYCFRAIHGRTARADHLKPDPECLHRALDSLDTDPSSALMIGDTPADLLAARAAGVDFLGYGRDAHRQERLHAAGADLVVDSLGPVLDLVWQAAQA
uniref:HAD family hydrolase n=1 Tax=Streptomyces polyasparticus TaxID=2767826 RepID=UPI00280A501B|nr:HAD-IA family hydrolase [Streptomyces polyasparticus]